MHDVHIERVFKVIVDSFNIMLGLVDRGQPGGCSIPAIVPQDNLIAQLDVALEILVANSQNLDVGSIGVRKKNCLVGFGLLIGFGMQYCALYQLIGRCPDHLSGKFVMVMPIAIVRLYSEELLSPELP